MGLLDGQYTAMTSGRSLDFDDLRSYVPGDDVKDIDWKSSARAGEDLAKRAGAGWSWRESNPRPRASNQVFSGCSQ